MQSPSTPRPKSRLAPAMIVAGSVVAVVLVGGYLLGYLWGTQTGFDQGAGYRIRKFSAKWQCAIYIPAARAESALLKLAVYLCYEDRGPIPIDQEYYSCGHEHVKYWK